MWLSRKRLTEEQSTGTEPPLGLAPGRVPPAGAGPVSWLYSGGLPAEVSPRLPLDRGRSGERSNVCRLDGRALRPGQDRPGPDRRRFPHHRCRHLVDPCASWRLAGPGAVHLRDIRAVHSSPNVGRDSGHRPRPRLSAGAEPDPISEYGLVARSGFREVAGSWGITARVDGDQLRAASDESFEGVSAQIWRQYASK